MVGFVVFFFFLAGLARQISAPVDELVGLDLVLPVLAPDRLEQHHRGGKGFNTPQNNGKKQNKGGVERNKGSTQLVFTSVNEAHTGSCTCRMENTMNVPDSRCKWNTHVVRPKLANTHRSRKKGLRKGEERGKRGRTLLRRCEVTSAQSLSSNSEVLQSEH